MTEKLSQNEGINKLLEEEYGDAKIELLDEILNEEVVALSRRSVERAIVHSSLLNEEDVLILKAVRLDKNFKPISMIWKLNANSDQAKKLQPEGAEIYFQYLVRGNHVNGESSKKSSLVRNNDHGDPEKNFSVQVAEYSEKKNERGWWRLEGWRSEGEDVEGWQLQVLKKLGYKKGEDEEITEAMSTAVMEYLTETDYEGEYWMGVLPFEDELVEEGTLVYEDEILRVIEVAEVLDGEELKIQTALVKI